MTPVHYGHYDEDWDCMMLAMPSHYLYDVAAELMLSVEQQATWSSGGPTMSHYLDEEKA
jgi:hypothetical protein